MQNPVIIPFGEIQLQVRPDAQHKWLLETKLVAEAYGITEAGVRMHKAGYKDELIEGTHFISVNNPNANPRAGIPHISTFWTREGVVMLGFFIKSDRAKEFRKFASNLIVNGEASKPTAPNVLPSFRELALMVIQSEDARIAAEEAQRLAELEAQKQKTIVQELAPKATYTDKILTATNSWLTTTIADELGMSAVRLNQELEKRRVQRKVDGKWVLYAEHQGKGYTDTKTFDYVKSDRTFGTKINTVWTEKGRYFIHNLLNPVLTTTLKPIDE